MAVISLRLDLELLVALLEEALLQVGAKERLVRRVSKCFHRLVLVLLGHSVLVE